MLPSYIISNLCSLVHTHPHTNKMCIYPNEQWNEKQTWSMKIELLLRWPQSSNKRILFPRPEKYGCKSKDKQSNRKVPPLQSTKVSFHLYYTEKGGNPADFNVF